MGDLVKGCCWVVPRGGCQWKITAGAVVGLMDLVLEQSQEDLSLCSPMTVF